MLPLAILCAAAVLASSPVLAIGAPGLQGAGFDDNQIRFYGEHLAQELALAGAKVTTPREIQAAIGLERDRKLLGCNDSGCLVELANALGADAILVGDVARIGTKVQVNLKLVAAKDAQTVAIYSDRVQRDDEILDALAQAAKELAQVAAEKLGRSLAPVQRAKQARPASMRSWSWAPLALGGAALAAGGVSAWQANSLYARLTTTSSLDVNVAYRIRNEGMQWRLATQVALGVGGAAVLAGGAMYLFGEPAPAKVTLVPLPGGGAFASFEGRLP